MKAKTCGLLFSVLLLALSAGAQTIDGRLYTRFNNWYLWRGGAFDSTLLLPHVQATAGLRAGALRYNTADTSVYVFNGSAWVKISGTTDTTSLSNRINLKLNISDTTAMLAPYLRSNVAAATYVPQSRTITINGTTQDLSANRTFTIPAADSSVYATVTRLRDTAAAIRSTISGQGVSFGTYADRVALTNSVNPGHMFYQTDERIGVWVKSLNNKWQHYPTRFVFQLLSQTNLTAAPFIGTTSGVGASAGKIQDESLADSSYPVLYRLQTGTTSTGWALYLSPADNFTGFPPIDPDTTQKSVYVLTGRFKITDTPTSDNNYRLVIGWRSSQNNTSDSTGTGHFFRMSFHENSNVMAYSVPISGAAIKTPTTVSIASLVGRFVDYTIVYTSRRAWFYIDGVLVAYNKLTVPSNQLVRASNPFIQISKNSGTNSRQVLLSDFYVYQTFIQ